MTLITTDTFTGPFSVLLSLIEDEKLSITELSLSAVTEQYLAYLETLEERKAEELSDFLVVASRLLLLKARVLLPNMTLDDEDEKSLAAELRLYKRFVDASKNILAAWNSDAWSSGREEPIQMSTEFVPPNNLTAEGMHTMLLRLLKKIRPPKPIPKMQIDRAVTLKEAIGRIRQALERMKRFTFDQCLSEKQNRTEVVMNFLALLELVKQRSVHLQQSDTFGTIHIQSSQ